MCRGDTVEIEITQRIRVDSCIADEIKRLNALGIRTESCCCGHGEREPSALIQPSSVIRALELGYIPRYRTDVGLHEIILKRANTKVTGNDVAGDRA